MSLGTTATTVPTGVGSMAAAAAPKQQRSHLCHLRVHAQRQQGAVEYHQQQQHEQQQQAAAAAQVFAYDAF